MLLGLNGLGSCATQYASEYMDVVVRRDGKKYTLRFEKGRIVGEMKSEPADRKKTGTDIRWRPDLEVFTDIDIPLEYYRDMLRRQAVVNAGVTFRLKNEVAAGKFETEDFVYEQGILDYVGEKDGQEVTANGRNKSQAIPHGYIVHQINDKVWFGLGMTVPFGMGTEYDDDWAGNKHGISATILTFDLNPNFAFKLSDKFSVGFGASVQYAQADLKIRNSFGNVKM